MTFIHWLAGLSGQIFASASTMTILVLMVFMAVKLYQSYRRNSTYLMLIIVLLITLVQSAVLLAMTCSAWTEAPYWQLVRAFLDLLTFIIINFVFMKLYTGPSAKLRGVPFLIMLVGLALITAVQVAFTPNIAAQAAGTERLGFVAVDFYGLALTLIILLNMRRLEHRFNYSASLIVYFLQQMTGMADNYVFHGEAPLLVIFNHLLPVVYYTLLFLLLFEWVLERLMMTFQSAITDGLTSLYNRRHFTKKAEQLLRERKRIAIIFCDIDNFKKLNDTQGHHKADGVLKQVADILREETAGIGTAGRYGGEELLGLVAAPDAKPEAVAEAIRSRVEKETMVTISVGVSMTRDGSTIAEAVSQADEAMYQSKTTGKNKVTLHASMRAKSRTVDNSSKQNAQV